MNEIVFEGTPAEAVQFLRDQAKAQDAKQERWFVEQEARGDLAGEPETMECYECGGFRGPGTGVERKVAKLGRVVNRADPTQTYVLECGHTEIAC